LAPFRTANRFPLRLETLKNGTIMTDTANLGLPCIEGSQAQKHITHNDALRILDTLVQLAVLDRDLTAPPGSPTEGQRWIVNAGATDAWAGHDNAVGAWQDGAWQFSTPQVGWVAFVVDEGTLLVWNGSAWGDFFATVTSLQNLALLGVGTTADATNPFGAKLNNALWTAKTVAEGGDGDLRYKLNKEAAANTLSFLFQDNYSGRAEIGTIADDNFSMKVSADGTAWHLGLSIDKDSGKVDHPQGSKFSAYVNYDDYHAAGSFAKISFNAANHNDQNAFSASNSNFTAAVDGYYQFSAHYLFKENASLPTRIMLALFVNDSEAPQTRVLTDTVIDEGSCLHTSAVLKLSAGDVVDARCQFVTNDGFVAADYNHFAAARVA
jgi:hypothetical protein